MHDIEFSRLIASRYTESELIKQQISLEEDLKQINNYIVQRAQELDLPHIRLNSALEKVSYKLQGKSRGSVKGHLRHCYKCLYDGVHPDDSTKTKWADLVTTYIVKALYPPPEQAIEESRMYKDDTGPSAQVTINPEETTTEESQSEGEGWNHKRRKTTP